MENKTVCSIFIAEELSTVFTKIDPQLTQKIYQTNITSLIKVFNTTIF